MSDVTLFGFYPLFCTLNTDVDVKSTAPFTLLKQVYGIIFAFFIISNAILQPFAIPLVSISRANPIS